MSQNELYGDYALFVAKCGMSNLRAFLGALKILYIVYITRYLPNIVYISLEPYKKISLMRDYEGTTQGYLKVNDIIRVTVTW